MKRIIMLAAILAMTTGIADAKNCRGPKGFIKCPPAAAAMSAAPTASAVTSSSKKAPHCKIGKPCGGSCISMKDQCRK